MWHDEDDDYPKMWKVPTHTYDAHEAAQWAFTYAYDKFHLDYYLYVPITGEPLLAPSGKFKTGYLMTVPLEGENVRSIQDLEKNLETSKLLNSLQDLWVNDAINIGLPNLNYALRKESYYESHLPAFQYRSLLQKTIDTHDLHIYDVHAEIFFNDMPYIAKFPGITQKGAIAFSIKHNDNHLKNVRVVDYHQMLPEELHNCLAYNIGDGNLDIFIQELQEYHRISLEKTR